MKVAFSLFIRCALVEKAERVCRRVFPDLTFVTQPEKYFKDPGLFTVRFQVPIAATGLGDAVVESLQRASALASHWVVAAPGLYEGGQIEFHGDAAGRQISTPGVELAE